MVEVIRRNLRACGLYEHTQVLAADAAGYLARRSERFDIALLDPPYASGAGGGAAGAHRRVHEPRRGDSVCETDASQALPEQAGAFRLIRVYRVRQGAAAPVPRPGGLTALPGEKKGMDV